ncbi:MAG TPA: polysaccharide biosynthesis tyrosine autokinase [Acetobacteraceae bacterium]
MSSSNLISAGSAATVMPPDPAEPAPLDIRGLIGGLLRRWKLIVAVPLAALIAVHLLLHVLPPTYQSAVQLLVFDPHQAMSGVTGERPASPQDFDTVAINTEIDVLKSASLSQRVVEDLKLYDDPEFQPRPRFSTLLGKADWLGLGLATAANRLMAALGLGTGWFAETPPAAAPPAMSAEQRIATAAAILAQKIRVDRSQFSYVLAVSATSRTAERAQQIATTLVADYLKGQLDAQRKTLDQLAMWLEGKLSELKTRVAETQTQIETLKAQSGLTDTGKGSLKQQQIADLTTQLTLARADLNEKRARLDQARQLSQGSGSLLDIPEAASSPVISQLRMQQLLLTQLEEQLRAKLGDRHAQVLAVAAQLADVNKQIQGQAAHVLGDLQNSYDISLRREQAISESLNKLTAVPSDTAAFVKIEQLQRIADADGKLYDAYLSQYNEIVAREALGSTTERIISPAGLPTDPIFPKRLLFYIAAVGLGGMLGLGLALAADLLQTHVKMGTEAEQLFGYPVIGNIPSLPRQRSRRLQRDGNRGLVRSVATGAFSPVNEAIRAMRVNLRLSNLDRELKVILVTSALPAEGKSAVAALLAASSAAAGQRTVLLDCDVRGRRVSLEFGQQHPGLTDLLVGKAELSEVTLRDPDSGCHVIPAGSRMPNPGDTLGSRGMAELMTRLRAEYDYIVIDTPPLLSVVDALVLATMADKVLMVIDGSHSHSDSVTEAFRLLRPEARRIAGIAFNKVAPDQLRHYGYYGAYGEAA